MILIFNKKKKVLEKIKKGEYPPFPQYDHSPLPGFEEDLKVYGLKNS